MLSPARFYKMKGALTSGEYPLFQEGQILTDYLVHEVTIKHTKDIQQVVRVPAFEGFRDVNVCEIEGLFYWVTAFHENTIEESSVRFVLDLMAPTSFIRKGDILKGAWTRSPFISNNRRMKQLVTNDVLKETVHVDFDTITMPDNIAEKLGDNTPDGVFWVQISSVSNRKVLGCFCSYKEGFPFGQRASGNNAQMYASRIYYDRVSPPGTTTGYYPTLSEILSDIYTATGSMSAGATVKITAETLDNISISDKCPYDYTCEMRSYVQSSTTYWFPQYRLTGGSLFSANPGSCVFYDLTSNPPAKVRKTKTVTLTDTQAITGDVKLRDQINNIIMTIPTEMFDPSGSLDIAYTTYGDMSGLYTTYEVGPLKETRPEGKLPWIGSAVATYNAYSWDSDRMALQFANNDAQRGFETDWNYYMGQSQTKLRNAQRDLDESSIMAFGSAITLGGGIGDLVGNWFTQQHLRSDMLNDQELLAKKLESSKANLIAHNEEQFKLTTKRAISQPSPTYNTGYGMLYCRNALYGKCRVSIDMPSNLTQTYYDNWISEYGYVTEGIIDMEMTEGFYSGNLLSNGQLVGLYFDELNKDFMRGFKFVQP